MENFYTLYGEDKALVKHKCNEIVKTLQSDDIIKYDMNITEITEVIDDASTIGMFSNKKIIILDDSNFLIANKTINNLEKLEEYLNHYNPNNCLIFLVYHDKIDTRKKINKLLSKHKVIEIKKQEEKDLINYVYEYLKKNNYEMEDIDYFLSRVGSSILNINNELDKLMMYKIKEKNITRNDIEKISTISSEEEIFALTDSIIAKDTRTSLKLLETFINKSYDEMQILMLLASQFRFFFQVKRLLNKNFSSPEIAKTLEANPYRVKFTINKLYNYTESDLLTYIKKLAKIDHDIKLGLMNKRLALELFITMNV